MNLAPESQPGESAQPTTWGREGIPSPLILVPAQDPKLARVSMGVAKTLSRIMGGEVHLLGISEERVSTSELLRRLGLHPEVVSGAVVEQASGPLRVAIAGATRAGVCSMIVTAEWRRRKDSDCELLPDLEEMLAETMCPAMVIPVDNETTALRSGRRMQRVLLPLDGTPETAAAIQPAVDLAYAAGAEIDVIHVVSAGQERSGEPGSFGAPRYVDHPEHDWPAWSHEFITRFLTCVAECPVRPRSRVFLRSGDLVDEVLKFAEEETPSIIAMTWHGRFDHEHESAVKRVLCGSKSPVMLTRAEAPPPTVWREAALAQQPS